jgi:hypothetical protein
MSAVDLATVTADTFELRRQDEFRLGLRDGHLDLRLSEVNRLGQALRAGGAFSLMFLSKDGPALPQAMYSLTHPALGTLEIFLVPIGPVRGGRGYEAVFT